MTSYDSEWDSDPPIVKQKNRTVSEDKMQPESGSLDRGKSGKTVPYENGGLNEKNSQPPFDFRSEVVNSKDPKSSRKENGKPPGRSSKPNYAMPQSSMENDALVYEKEGEGHIQEDNLVKADFDNHPQQTEANFANDLRSPLQTAMKKARRFSQSFSHGLTSPDHGTEQRLGEDILSLSTTEYTFNVGEMRRLVIDRTPSRLLDSMGSTPSRKLLQFWSEIFTAISLPVLVVTTFLYSLLRFTVAVIIRPLLLTPIEVFGDQLIKPTLSILHNSMLLPLAMFIANVISAFGHVARSTGEALDSLLRPLGSLLSSIRLVYINNASPYKRKTIQV